MPATRRCSRPRSSVRAALGQQVVELDFAPLFDVAALLYEGPWVAERHSVVRELLADQPEAFDPTVRQVIARAAAFSATDTFEAQYRLRALQRELQALWQQVDVLMVPTAPGHPRFDEVDADPLGVNARLGTYTNFVNLLGWCALALPAGSTAAGPALRRDLHRRRPRTTSRWPASAGAGWRLAARGCRSARRPPSRRCRSPWSARTCPACR